VGQGKAVRIRMEDTRLSVRETSGVALSLWAAEQQPSSPVEVRLEGNTIQTGHLAALRALPSRLTVLARGNRFLYRMALLSYSGLAERDAWRGSVWQGSGNSFQGPPSWLWVEGKPIAATEQPSIR
jgi:hypothetical protein